MRKTVTVLGVDRRTGTSAKNNKAYDFTEVHFCYDEANFRGQKCAVASVDTASLPYPLEPGVCADMVFHYGNGRCFIDAVL